jgi:hypothetical protein
MQLHPLVIVFAIFWLLAALSMTIGIGVTEFSEHGFVPEMLIPVGFLVFFLILVSASFNFEARRAHSLLREIAAAPRVVPSPTPETPAR